MSLQIGTIIYGRYCSDLNLLKFANHSSHTINDGTSPFIQAIEKLFQLSLDTQLVPQSQTAHQADRTLVPRLSIACESPTERLRC